MQPSHNVITGDICACERIACVFRALRANKAIAADNSCTGAICTENYGCHTENDGIHTKNDESYTKNDGFHSTELKVEPLGESGLLGEMVKVSKKSKAIPNATRLTGLIKGVSGELQISKTCCRFFLTTYYRFLTTNYWYFLTLNCVGFRSPGRSRRKRISKISWWQSSCRLMTIACG